MTFQKVPVESIPILMYPDGRLDAKNASKYLGLKEKTLAMMRWKGIGPRFIKRGRIFYFKDDLDNWLNADDRLTSAAQNFSLQKIRKLSC
jgi:hypothetical protein